MIKATRVSPGMVFTLMCLTLFSLHLRAHAATFKVGVSIADADVFDYELSVIRLALEHAPGDHQLDVVLMPEIPQNRIFAMLSEGEAPFNLYFSGYSRDREKNLLQVDIPLTRGLLGIRLFAVKATRLEELGDMNTLEDLLRRRIGSGIGWPENTILRQNGLKLDVSTYENLWRMLDYDRFELFHRGVQEIYTELAGPGREELTVLPGIALAMRYDYFLYVARDRQDLHDILKEGLQRAYRNGAFMENFRSHPQIRTALEKANLSDRTLLWLDMPSSNTLGEIPDEYWHFSPVAEPNHP